MKYRDKDKSEWLAALRDQFRQWNELIAGLRAEQITSVPPGDYSVKQAVAHNWAWEQLTLARLEAALEDREVRFSLWPTPHEAGDDDELQDSINANIQAMTHDLSWERIYTDWQKTFQRVIELTEQLPEDKLMEEGRYPFMGGYRLMGQITTTWDHHGEHLRDLKTHLGISPESK
jgi:hypothetical protein